MNVQRRRQWADRLRCIPLDAVLRAAGAQPDLHDKTKWHTARGVLSVNGSKFMNWNQGRGGGGAIDLAMQLNATDFHAALQWLAERFPCPAPTEPVTPMKPQLAIPLPDAAHQPRVKRYLLAERGLSATLLEPLIQSGRLYADSRANAVFLLLNPQQEPVGAELRGTAGGSWHGLARGSRKDLGYFSVGPGRFQDVVLCESAIDAISCATLYADRFCISTSGARSNPAWLADLLDQGHRVSCGFDADPAGDLMAQNMIALHPAVQRLRPPLHDWNDVLTASH